MTPTVASHGAYNHNRRSLGRSSKPHLGRGSCTSDPQPMRPYYGLDEPLETALSSDQEIFDRQATTGKQGTLGSFGEDPDYSSDGDFLEDFPALTPTVSTQSVPEGFRGRLSYAIRLRRMSLLPSHRPQNSLHRVLRSLLGTPSSQPGCEDPIEQTKLSSVGTSERPFEYLCRLRSPSTPHLRNVTAQQLETPENLRDASCSIDLVSPGAFLFSGPELATLSSSTLGRPVSTMPSQISLNADRDDGSDIDRASSSERTVSSADSMTPVEGLIPQSCLISYTSHNMSGLLLPDGSCETGSSSRANAFQQAERRHSMPEDLLSIQTAQRRTSSAPVLPRSVLLVLRQYLDRRSFYALRSTCRTWFIASSNIPSPPSTIANSLPFEMIQSIYSYLTPKDFNAARHTCHSWMLASLDHSVLRAMLKRGGWWSGALADLWALSNDQTWHGISEEWILSRRVSRECALAAEWTGNGLNDETSDEGQIKAFAESTHIDFSDLLSGYTGPAGMHDTNLIFNVSVCGQYLLVAEAGMIYIYAFDGTDIRPMTSVVCPRKVLAMSMDASSRRFAVAALLEGRMGLVCNLQVLQQVDTAISPLGPGAVVESSSGHRTTRRSSLFTSRLYPQDDRSTSIEEVDERAIPSFNVIDVRNGGQSAVLQGTDNARWHHHNIINQTWNVRLRGGYEGPHPYISNSAQQAIHVETGPRSIYRHLCSEDDPPRSVAICPQRRCVAFGCAAGIELHWVDAITGQDLNRWFPLTAPSDFLYFLNPRSGVDSAHKLRIISSVAHPNDRQGLYERFHTGKFFSAFWNLPNHTDSPHAYDHYRAVPLSDGYHHLFTDPITETLHLGSDAPLGGSIKLLRKIQLAPPAHLSDAAAVPSIYAAGADLTHGARVIAVFGPAVCLYSIPADVLVASRAEQKDDAWLLRCECECWNACVCERGATAAVWRDWWDPRDLPRPLPLPDRAPWPLRVRGVVVGRVDGDVVDVGVNEDEMGGGLCVWALLRDARAVAWRLSSNPRPARVRKKAVVRDGGVVDADEESDVWLGDAWDVDALHREDMDGDEARESGASVVYRIPRAFHVENDENVEMVDVPVGAWYDDDGDLIMLDAPPLEGE